MDIQQNASSMAGERHQCGAVDSRQVVALVGECSECLDATSRRPTRPSADRMPRPAARRSGVSFSLGSKPSFPSSSPLSRVIPPHYSLLICHFFFVQVVTRHRLSVFHFFHENIGLLEGKKRPLIAHCESNKVLNRV